MKNFGTFLILVFFFSTVKSDYWSQMIDKINKETELTIKMAKLTQQEAELTQQRAESQIATIQKETDEILAIAEKIEKGNSPANVKSNTTSLSTNVRGKIETVKSTIYSIGNDKEGAIYDIKTVYEDSRKTYWLISTIEWDGNGRRQHFSTNGPMTFGTRGNNNIFNGKY